MHPAFPYCLKQIDPRYPFLFFDIGAMGGIPQKWEPLGEEIKIVAFEPDPREFSKLTSSERRRYLNCLLYHQPEKLSFYISRESGKSSVYRPNGAVLSQFMNPQRFDTIEEKEIPSHYVKNLDAVIAEHSFADVDFLKLDTQGSELAILQGGRQEVLPKTFGMQIEVEFLPLYERQPLFGQIDQWLTEQNFQLIDLRRAYWKRKDYYDYFGKGQLVFGDALYFKKIEALAEELSRATDPVYPRSKIYKCIVTCLVYRMFDYAAALVQMGREKRYFSEGDAAQTSAMIKEIARSGHLPNFWGRSFLYRVFRKLSEQLLPASHLGWADGDRVIGNVKDI